MPTVDELAAWLSSPKMAGGLDRTELLLVATYKHNLHAAWSCFGGTLSGHVQVVFDGRTGRSVVIKGCPQFCQYLRHDQSMVETRTAQLKEYQSGALSWAPIGIFEGLYLLLFPRSQFREWRARFRLPKDRVCKLIMRQATRDYVTLGCKLGSDGVRYLPEHVLSPEQVSLALSTYKCAHCGRSRTQLQKCGRCGGPGYCDKHCQRADWSSGHRSTCTPT
jgi:hypothetical protein